MLKPIIRKNDTLARTVIFSVSILIFILVSFLGKYQLPIEVGFNVHIFALLNAIINSLVSIVLVAALVAVKRKNYLLHKRLMFSAIVLSVFFFLTYIAHHLLAGEARFGDVDKNGIVTADEKALVGNIRYFYYLILFTHILLAGIILPFILFTAYRALTGEWVKHKRLARYTWPVWFYVAITGTIIYLMIRPYY